MALKIKKGDTVVVRSGIDRKKTGKVLDLNNDKGVAYVEGVHMRTHFQKANPQQNVEGKIYKKEGAIHLSNIAYYNENTKKPARVGFKLVDGKKVRYDKVNNDILD